MVSNLDCSHSERATLDTISPAINAPVISATPNATSVKIKLDHGADVNGDRIIKTKTLTNIKSTASNDDIMAVVNAIVDLQKHTLSATNRVDNSSLSE